MILAAAVGSLVMSNAMADASNSTSSASATPSVKCMGGNGCKGQSACKTASNSCKGMNNCKGTGMILTATETECTEKGGKVMADDGSAKK